MGCALSSSGAVATYSCGMADTTRRVPVQNDSLFHIAPVGKLFTTVAILKLIETGQFTLQTAMGDLPEDLPTAWFRVGSPTSLPPTQASHIIRIHPPTGRK